MSKKLGRIKTVYFGLGGYQDVCIGIHFTFDFDGCGVSSTKSAWDPTVMKCTEYCKWTEESRSEQLDEIVRYISQLLADAKVDRVDKLQGKPVEITLDGNTFKSFRILTEVL
jgi:hypothetical protein